MSEQTRQLIEVLQILNVLSQVGLDTADLREARIQAENALRNLPAGELRIIENNLLATFGG